MVTRYTLFLESIHADLIRIMDEMTFAELNWRPSKTINSIGNMIRHVIGAESFWIHEVIGGTKIERNRESEFNHVSFRLSNLKELQKEVHQTSREVLHKQTNRDLENIRTYWSAKEQLSRRSTIHQCLLHVTTHSARHIGQIYYLRKLYLERPSHCKMNDS
ncbi:MAG: DinB family protein [Candidatus Thorarchaeota archaeon]